LVSAAPKTGQHQGEGGEGGGVEGEHRGDADSGDEQPGHRWADRAGQVHRHPVQRSR